MKEPGMVAHSYNPSYEERIQGQLGHKVLRRPHLKNKNWAWWFTPVITVI
jgi:cytochrome c-type biogenesis protein CcmH/NrfF